MMKTNITKPLLAIVATALLLASQGWAVNPREATGGVFAASDGKGSVFLFWVPPAGPWPAAWRVSSADGKTLIDHVAPGEADTMQGLSQDDIAAIQNLQKSSSGLNAQQQTALVALVGVRAMSDAQYARAAGLLRTLENVPRGARSYHITGLGANGQPTGVALTSPSVDSGVATPLAPAPTALRAEVGRQGIALFWSASPASRMLPVIAYTVERGVGGQSSPITEHALVRGLSWDSKTPGFTDQEPPVEQQVQYRVYALDLFGRKSAPAESSVFVPDLKALLPPEPVTATVQPGKVVVQWSPSGNPYRRGYVVERAYLHSGPYEALTPKGVSSETANYEDTDIRGGTSYYYRVRSVGPRGDVGDPSRTAMAQPQNVGKPPQPANVVADIGSSRVRLTWSAVKSPVAGYFVERRNDDLGPAAPWDQLNDRVTAEPQYDDYLGVNASGNFSYRVVAVGYDSQVSRPSSEIQVKLESSASPPVPHIDSADGAGGKIVLTFTPALPENRTAQFFVLRSGAPGEQGVVIGDPLPDSARRFEDDHVQAGQDYWYRLVAVDHAGNRSDPSQPVVVRVGSPALPAAPKPVLSYVPKPFPQVKISFQGAPSGLGVVVERRAESETGWLTLVGPTSNPEAVDANPPSSGTVFYRIVYQAENGAQGAPSEPVQLVR